MNRQSNNERFREVVKKNGLTLKSVATILGVSYRTVGSWHMTDSASTAFRTIPNQALLRLEQAMREVPRELKLTGPDGDFHLLTVLEYERIPSLKMTLTKVIDDKTNAIFPVLQNEQGIFTPSAWVGDTDLPNTQAQMDAIDWISQKDIANQKPGPESAK